MGLDISFLKKKNKEVAYFRKINFLIPAIEEITGETVENCQDIELSKNDIEKIIHRCKLVLSDHSLAPEYLPTQEGFFFGNTDYDDSYFEDVREVEDSLEKNVLPEFDNLKDDESIVFSAWW